MMFKNTKYNICDMNAFSNLSVTFLGLFFFFSSFPLQGKDLVRSK